MSVRPRNRSFDVPGLLAVAALLVLNLSVGIGGPSSPPAPTSVRTLLDPNPCPGPILPHNYSGTVEVYGAPSARPVSLLYSYAAVVTTALTDGDVLSTLCSSEKGTLVTNVSDTFTLSIDPTQETNCTPPTNGLPGQCVSISGPYELVNVTPTSPAPPGYFPSVTQNGTNFVVEYYPYLAIVRLDPSGPSATFSPGGTDGVRAYPMTGTGTPSPGVPQFEWTLTGIGWTFAGPPNSSEVNVTAAPGAGIGNLTVVASLAVAGGTLTAPPASLELLAVATTISSASLNRTVLDLGQSVGVDVNGSGAAGYAYSATLHPGLGEAAAPASCASSPGLGGVVAFSCTATMIYTEVGVAQPVITVSNGASAAAWQFPDVTVDPAPSFLFLPGVPVGYANATIPVEVQVETGTGVSPYSEACLAAGSGPVECITTPGPTWTFAPVYPEPGRYSVLAWAIDATGFNWSATTLVRVVAPLEVALIANSTVGTAGTPISLAAVISGGDLPARVWWNATAASNPVASEWVAADGPVAATFLPSTAGFVTVSVAVVDALGTIFGASETWTVGVGKATSVVPVVLLPTSSVRAGMPLAMSWQALDAVGEAVHDFATAAEIELAVAVSHGGAAGWVNASGVGPLASRLPGWFDVPKTAWIGGALDVSVTSQVSGAIQIDLLVAGGLPVGGGTVGVVVLPDIDHLRLFGAQTVTSGGPANDTLWQVTDRFGNPADGASVVITTSFAGSSARTLAPVISEPDGATEVWTNFSTTDAFAGTVMVTDLAGDALLPPIAVAGLPGPFPLLFSALPILLAAGMGATIGAATFFRGRRPRPVETGAAADDEAALQRLAEGRETVVEVVRRTGPLDLAGLVTAWEPPPAPPDLADWVASLLTDGTLEAAFGDDGVARFCLAVDRRSGAHVTLDLEAFDRAQVRRDAAAAEWERDEP